MKKLPLGIQSFSKIVEGDYLYVDKTRYIYNLINNESYYKKTGLLIICPISNTKNNFPLHLELTQGLKTTGFVLTQHIRTIDPEARPLEFIESAPEETINQVLNFLELFFN